MGSFFTSLLSGMLKGATGNKRARRKTPVSERPAAKPAARGHGDYSQEVVGEASYQVALQRLRSAKGRPFHRARLVPEDDNPYDESAVRVDIAGQVVGYLSRPQAREWRRRSGPTSCDAYLADAGSGKNIGVWLRF
jgi:hypothetical protein